MSRMRKIRQITDNSHLNFFEMEVEDRKGHTFPYYMASRAVDTSGLKMNGAGAAGPAGRGGYVRPVR